MTRSAAKRIIEVIVDAPVPQPLDYLCAADTQGVVGQRCVVPLGRRRVVGLIVAAKEESAIASERLRAADPLLADIGPLSDHWLEFTRFAADYYQHGWGEVALPALPPSLRAPPGPRFAAMLTRWRRAPDPVAASERPALVHTPDQAAAIAALDRSHGFSVALLFGATGSGKTEVYLSILERRLARDARAQALLLVPEILLTPQLERLVQARFGADAVVTLHSGLRASERDARWLRAHEGRARVIVGTRLAVFASLPSLSIIVVDEEHDPSYKAGEGVRYSARDLAIKRAQMLGAPVILGSATPSSETWAAARSGRYSLHRLKERATGAAATAVELIDLHQHRPCAGGLSPPALAALAEVLGRREQSLVFLNRRGYAPVVACNACGWLSQCRHCSTFAVFHKVDRSLRCHHCGAVFGVPSRCPTCGNPQLHGVGQGTQRVEEALQQHLPGARIARIDRDSTRQRLAGERAFDAMHAGDVDVLVGTQMIAKGHDYQRVTLVVVLNVDGQLASHDFRAPERLYATLLQVAGRAGRAGMASRVLLQTRYPTHPLFVSLIAGDYAAFADALLIERQQARMPPFSHQALLVAEAAAMPRALAFLAAAKSEAASDEVRIYEPVPMALQRRAGVERAQLLIEADHRSRLQAFLKPWLAGVRGLKAPVRWHLEVDPQTI